LSKSPSNNRRARREDGFTLIEVIVALAIAAIGLGALVAAAGQGLRNVTAANLYMEATRRAQSHLDMIGLTKPPVEGEQSGDDGGGFIWRVKVAPVVSQAPPKGSNKDPLTLYDVTVTISWKNDGQVKSVWVQSEKLGRLTRS
jgi:general secretion pathway protein I